MVCDPGWANERRDLDGAEKGRGVSYQPPEASLGSLPEIDTLLLPPALKQAVLLCACACVCVVGKVGGDMHI